ncbi:hypothetical protein NY547_12210 [Cnuibacter physcomitrellae]|uniref:hypothetical protein n=1 Tax=Cnuibacter physcomitrellae TaxID=1619308 RepID=UPI002175F1EA|nr:hypothetical protein [Cnuibacter physcomitrellae]MCS5498004.1 hypothetical protein [Cnuibacter physcomitrellae]
MSDDMDRGLAARQAADSELEADALDTGAGVDGADPGVVDPADVGTGDGGGAADQDTIEDVTDEVRDDIRQGRIEDDVSHVLEERLDEVGVHLRPEVVDDLAEDIENDVSS